MFSILICLIIISVPVNAAVLITSPADAATVTEAIITLRGSIANPVDGFAVLTLNGITQDIGLDTSVSPATFTNQIILSPGNNTINVSDTTTAGREETTIVIIANISLNDIRVTLTWDGGQSSDVDLYLHVPGDEQNRIEEDVIYYGDKTSPTGGNLDVDDVQGFGPENITFLTGKAVRGIYSIGVNMYAIDADSFPIRAKIILRLYEGQANQVTREFGPYTFSAQDFGSSLQSVQPASWANGGASWLVTRFAFPPEFVEKKATLDIVNFPNPFVYGNATTINFIASDQSMLIELRIVTMTGREIRILRPDSTGSIIWDGKDNRGNLVASGFYLCWGINSAGTKGTGKITFVK